MLEQIRRLFDSPESSSKTTLEDSAQISQPPVNVDDSGICCGETGNSKLSASCSSSSISEEPTAEETTNQLTFLHDLCSLILKKLWAAHAEFEKKFGVGTSSSAHSDECSRKPCKKELDAYKNSLGAIEQLAKVASELLGKTFMHRHLNILITNNASGPSSKDSVSMPAKHSGGGEVPNNSTAKNVDIATPTECSKDPTDYHSKTSVVAETEGSEFFCTACDGISDTVDVDPEDDNGEVFQDVEYGKDINFVMVERVPDSHRYKLNASAPANAKSFLRAVQKEITLLKNSLPAGIFIKGYEEKMVRE